MEQTAQWITHGTAVPFYARKTFFLNALPEKAVAKVCGLGQFQLYVNGRKVGDHVLDPAWTDYRKSVNVVSFDLAGLLRQGENVIAAEVGNGWFILDPEHYVFHFPPFMPPNPNPYKPFSDVLMLYLELEILCADGSALTVSSDETFKTAEHMIRHSNVFGSETMDGRLRIPCWAEPGMDDSRWPNARLVPESSLPAGRLVAQTIPPVRVIHTYEGKYLHTDPEGRLIYDFSQNMAGMLELELKGRRGGEFHIYPAEKLDADGRADQIAKGWLPIDVCETYIIGQDDDWETMAMTFTYFGGRYIAIELPPDGGAVQNVKAHAISSAGVRSGNFACDDPRFMQIYDLVEKAVEANMLSVHTDCPTIERFAWQEENVLMTPAIMFMKDIRLHMEKFLTDVREAQHTAGDSFRDMEGVPFYPGDGLIPAQAPCYMPNVLPVPGMGSFYDTIAWGSSIILGTRWHYLFYGDLRIVEENYEAGRRYLAHLKTKVNQDGFINHGLGDWGNPDHEYARENIETAFLYADADTLSWFAGLLGRDSEAGELREYAERVKRNYNEKLLVKDEYGKWFYRDFSHSDEVFTTQACLALLLYWGMVPEEHMDDVVSTLRGKLLERDCFAAGEVGLPYIIQVMAYHGMNDLICRFMLKPEHPSYYAFVLDGETALGEYWESNPRSHCHDMMGHIIEWYYNGLAGIRPLEPGFARIVIRPYLPDGVGSFRCSYRSASGEIQVQVDRVQDAAVLSVTVPETIKYDIDTSELKQTASNIIVRE